MDLQMPEMNGLEATRAIREREIEGNKRACIIGLTAHARREIMDDCLKAGMDRVLTKPVQMSDLYSAIGGCLE
jgi:CheY-like chemotaxis protein